MKPWIFSALGVGALVAVVLIVTARDEPERRRRRDLTEGEIQMYIRFRAAEDRLLTENSDSLMRTGKSKYPDMKQRMAKEVMKIGRTHNEMLKIRWRVQYVVDGVRWGENPSLAIRGVEDQIKLLESKKPASERERLYLRSEIDKFKTKLDRPRISDVDRALVKKHWRTLNRLAPRTFGQ